MASRCETLEKPLKQETSDSGSLCPGSNPCEAASSGSMAYDLFLNWAIIHLSHLLAIFLPFHFFRSALRHSLQLPQLAEECPQHDPMLPFARLALPTFRAGNLLSHIPCGLVCDHGASTRVLPKHSLRQSNLYRLISEGQNPIGNGCHIFQRSVVE